jgi:Na+/glutamate symporter
LTRSSISLITGEIGGEGGAGAAAGGSRRTARANVLDAGRSMALGAATTAD